ncbi:type II toxin-antitoxin system prevent-host-death family antitoxin [Chenggangzhangella methanolivorans]|uniref:type II toxin-antitoxin system prevent-host-death family antitoxin n=1 Tax=Chenggangzhangella methanolivorans TaxID=1437009 RepID=UPI00360D32FB
MQAFRVQDMQKQASVLQEAAMSEPVIITYHDRPRLVLMSMQEYDRLRGRRRVVGAAGELTGSVIDQIEALAEADVDAETPEMESSSTYGPRS